MNTAALRAQVEAALGPGFPSPFTFREPEPPELIPCGIPAIDALTGGLPRGSLTEIFGPPSSGRTSLLLSMLAELTAREEVCALVDAQGALDAQALEAAGVDPERLLWVRCASVEQALRSADLLLAGGGFGALALDLADLPVRVARRIPLSYWFRFRRMVEGTSTVLVLLGQESCAKSCASLVLRLEAPRAGWSLTAEEARTARCPEPPHARLLCGASLGAEVVRSRSAIRDAKMRCQWSAALHSSWIPPASDISFPPRERRNLKFGGALRR
jgi:hypothetical protein